MQPLTKSTLSPNGSIQFRRAQQKIIDQFVEHLFIKGEPGHACFAKIGSGKTLAGLEIINQLRILGEVKRTLVVAPVRVLSRTWPNEIAAWGYNYTHVKVNGSVPDIRGKDIVLCSPDSLHKIIQLAEQKAFDLILVDESQRFQGFTTLRMKNMKKILPHIPKRGIFTATPAANKLTQLFAQIYIIDDGNSLGKNVTVCRARFTDKGGFKGRQDIFRKDKIDEINSLIAPISTYISEDDIDFDYPALVTNDLICPLDDATRRAQMTLKEELYVALQSGETLTMSNAGAAYNSLKQLANGFLYGENKAIEHIHNAKLDAVESIANESTGQVLIFYWFDADRERLIKKLGAANCCCPKGLGDKAANKEIDKWMDHKKPYLVANFQSMSEGLNLQSPEHSALVNFGVPDSATIYLQAIGRLQRPGGAKHIFLHRVLLEDSIEQTMVDRLDGRITCQEDFLNGLKAWAKQ